MNTHNRLTHIIKRDGRVVPFDREKITLSIYKAAAAVGGHNRVLSEDLSGQVVRILNETYQPPDMPIVNEIQDITEKVLIENGHARTAKAYILYRDYRRRERERATDTHKAGHLPYRLMYESLVWNLEHGCDTIAGLNTIVASGGLPELVAAAEQAYNESIMQTARFIARQQERLKIIIIAGPSSSGKTTTTAKLSQGLNELGIQTVPLNLDHYFFDLEMHPRDEHGDYDFETPEALDLALINTHLRDLVDGKTIARPYYDFQTGRRRDTPTPMSIHADQVLILDTLHGLYEPLTQSVPNDRKIKIYIETISQLRDRHGGFVRWTDIRLLRRMIRDHATRGYDPMQTIGHWHYVRRSELKHIIPFMSSVDYHLNGALPYEFPFLKKYAFEYFPAFIKTWKNNPQKRDAYLRAERIYDLLSQITAYENESIIPRDSLLREFIGGSTLKLH